MGLKDREILELHDFRDGSCNLGRTEYKRAS